MAKSNRERVGEIMDLLKSGLGPYVLQQYKFVHKGKYLEQLELRLRDGGVNISLPDEAEALGKIDTQGWMKVMFFSWNDVFKDKLGHSERSYVSELMTARNKWAHQNPFTNEEAYRVADTATLLFQAVDAMPAAEAAAEHARELLRIRFDREADRSVKQQEQLSTPMDAFVRHTPVGLKPWRQVVQPHPDVRKGQYTLSEFSADLAQVVQGKASPEYGDAKEFFQRTYLTRGLQDLIVNCFLRLNGQGADPVVQLQTNFGGGKTHSLLALYHLAGGVRLREISGAEDIVQRIGAVDDFIKCQRAVIVGTDFDGTRPRDHADCTTHNLWGEIAYQLGGLPAYELVKEADQAGVSPGSSTLLELMEKHGPALIIIDELVAHARNLYDAKGGRYAANFDAIMTFVQALTEAVRRASDALLLISLPVSELEAGGTGGKEAMEFVSNTLGRMESVWKPVTATESYEIVRRRLFTDEIDRPARDAAVREFSKMYRDSPGEFPRDAGETDYLYRMEQAYPIHPELFDRLYKDWSTLEGFQQTRGVLRLMATVIHRLWMDNDHSLLIMPGSIPLWEGKVLHEILRYLPGNWPAIIEQDIDGGRSKPFQQDQGNKRFGEFMASRRVARAVFVGSAPSDRLQQSRGLTQEEVHLATVQPGESPAVFNDALRHMGDQLSYLYKNETRYWYDTRPTLNRTAADLAQTMEEYRVLEELAERLREQPWDKQSLGAVHILPATSAEVPDEQRARLVVLDPEHTHKSNNTNSAALKYIKDIMNSRGNSPRHHRNMLVFIAPDEARYAELQGTIRKYLAWESIKRKAADLNLDIAQIGQVDENIRKTGETVNSQLQATYSWLIVPKLPKMPKLQELQALQEQEERKIQQQRAGELIYEQERLLGNRPFLERAALKLKSNEWLIHELAPDTLLMELEPLGWRDMQHLNIKKLWEWLTNYCYLPRLANRDVLEATIHKGVNRLMPDFAYAAGVDENGVYSELAIGQPVVATFNESALIVQPEAARAQSDAERAAHERHSISLPTAIDAPETEAAIVDLRSDAPPPPKPKTRYYGSVQVNPQRAMRDLSQIADEIIVRLAALPGADVKITVEIESLHSDGFDDATVRAISENSRTLNFRDHGFDD